MPTEPSPDGLWVNESLSESTAWSTATLVSAYPVGMQLIGTSDDLVRNADTLRAHLDDLLDDCAQARDDRLAKAQVTIKPLPVKPVEQLKRDLLDAYEATMLSLNEALGATLERIADGDEALGDLDDHPLAPEPATP